MIILQLDEATAARRRIPIYLVDATDGFTPEVSVVTPTIEVSKNGAAQGAGGGTWTEVGDGLYYYEATAGEVDTVGFLNVRVVKGGVSREFQAIVQIVTWDPYRADWAVAGDAMDLITDAVDTLSVATGAIDADALATGAITAAKFAANAITSTVIEDNAITAGKLATGAITATKFASGAIDAAAIAADAIGSSELATTAVNEIRDAILSDSTPFAGANIDAAISSRQSETDASTRATTNQTEHDATQTNIAALNDLSSADVQTAMTSQGYTVARAGNLDNLDATVSSRQSEADASTRATTNQTEHDATQADIAAIAGESVSSQYQGAVWWAPNDPNAAAGTVVGTNGIPTNPVIDIADALTLVTSTGLNVIKVTGRNTGFFTFDANLDDIVLDSISRQHFINFAAGSSTDGTVFKNFNIRGTLANGILTAEDSLIVGPVLPEGVTFTRCGLALTISIAGLGDQNIIDCYQVNSQTSTPIISVTHANTRLHIMRYAGDLEIQDHNTGANISEINMLGGVLTLDSTCTGGTITVSGDCQLVDNSAGATVVDNRVSVSLAGIADAVWDEPGTGHDTPGTFGKIVRKTKKNPLP